MLEEIFEYPFLIKIFDSLLTDKEKINLFYVSKFIHEKKHKFTFEEEYFCDKKYKNKWFFNCLRNIKVKRIFEFPKFITKLKFDDHFDYDFGKIPSTITHLTFGHYFNRQFYDCIPNSVTHLTFGYCFNKRVNNLLPNSITHLTFGNNFNQPIHNSIPDSVTHLKFGDDFDQFIQNHIPKNVKCLMFGRKFDCPIVNSIPNSVTHLKFGQLFSRNLDVLPNSITHLYLSSLYNKTISRFPKNLEYLEAGEYFIPYYMHLIDDGVVTKYCFLN